MQLPDGLLWDFHSRSTIHHIYKEQPFCDSQMSEPKCAAYLGKSDLKRIMMVRALLHCLENISIPGLNTVLAS